MQIELAISTYCEWNWCSVDVNCDGFLNPCRLNWVLLWQIVGLAGWGRRESNGGEYEEFVKTEEN